MEQRNDETLVLNAVTAEDLARHRQAKTPAPTDRPLESALTPFSEPRSLRELLDAPPALKGPVLVSRAMSPLEELLAAVVYPLASMRGFAAPPDRRVVDELLRFCVG